MFELNGEYGFKYIIGFDDRFLMRIALENCSISRFLFNKEGWSVVCINDHCHINGSRSANFEARP